MLEFSITFFITFLNIAVLYFILRAILFKPVTLFMEKRSLKIKHELEQAAAEKANAEALRQSYEKILRDADAEAERLLREARDFAREQAAQIVEQGKADAARFLQIARAQIESERAAAAAIFKAEAAGLVIAATGRLLKRETTSEDARRSAAAFVAELGTE
jgi:F-type H+-transporting ATPase subunit b